jgi:hypothetical protein
LDITERVAFIPIDDDTKFFCFINGTVINQAKPYTFIHTTSYRLSNGKKRFHICSLLHIVNFFQLHINIGLKFNMTNETLAEYFGETINTPWRPWTGAASMSKDENEKQLLVTKQLGLLF